MNPGQRRSTLRVFAAALACTAAATVCAAEGLPLERKFHVPRHGEIVITITAACERCDWGVAGREAVVLELAVDGKYSQHLLLTRGRHAAAYPIMIGPLPAGDHTLRIARDRARSAVESGAVEITDVAVQVTESGSPDHAWIAEAPILHARPGTVEQFSDVPLAMYAELLPGAEGYRYTVIFSHEDGGTPTDRLMATWGRATDIEFVYESERLPGGAVRQQYQGPKHEILPFRGTRIGGHPLLWVSTDNNMVTDTGRANAIRFAPAPTLVDLTGVSRETVMDANPWLYAVMAAELAREGRIDAAAPAGSGKIPDPLVFGYIEACGDLRDATLAFDLGVRADTETRWYPTDRGDIRFRIARSGCFRAAVPLPPGTRASQISGLRARAYTRPPRQGETPLPAGSGRATLRRVNRMFMLDERFTPVPSGARWIGTLDLPADASAVEIRLDR